MYYLCRASSFQCSVSYWGYLSSFASVILKFLHESCFQLSSSLTSEPEVKIQWFDILGDINNLMFHQLANIHCSRLIFISVQVTLSSLTMSDWVPIGWNCIKHSTRTSRPERKFQFICNHSHYIWSHSKIQSYTLACFHNGFQQSQKSKYITNSQFCVLCCVLPMLSVAFPK